MISLCRLNERCAKKKRFRDHFLTFQMTTSLNTFLIEATESQAMCLKTKYKSHIEVSPNGEWAVALANAPLSWIEWMKGERKPLLTVVCLQSGIQKEFWLPKNNGLEGKRNPYDVKFIERSKGEMFIKVAYGSLGAVTPSYYFLKGSGRNMCKLDPEQKVKSMLDKVKHPLLSSPRVSTKEKKTKSYGDLVVLTVTIDEVRKEVEKESVNPLVVAYLLNPHLLYCRDSENVVYLHDLSSAFVFE